MCPTIMVFGRKIPTLLAIEKYPERLGMKISRSVEINPNSATHDFSDENKFFPSF